MSSSWALFQPLDRALTASPDSQVRTAATVARVLAIWSLVGLLIGLANLVVPGALYPGWRTWLYAGVMSGLALISLILAVRRRPGPRTVATFALAGFFIYAAVAVCVRDSPTYAPPLMLLFNVIGSALLLTRRGFLVACLLVPMAVILGLRAGWQGSGSQLALQVTVQTTVLVSSMVAIYWLRRRAERLLEFVRTAAAVDNLTDLYNRGGLAGRLHTLPARTWVVLIALDLDHFKQVNDVHGHAVGDRVLTAVADRLRRAVPEESLIARVGGEEFFILAPAQTPRQAAQLAARVQQAVGADPHPVPVTCSVGYTHQRLPGPAVDLVDWLWHKHGLADEALYAAKRLGRNRVIAAPPRTVPTQGHADGGDDAHPASALATRTAEPAADPPNAEVRDAYP